MVFPIGDDQVKGGYFPYVSYAFIGLNVIAFLLQMTHENLMICQFGSVPNDILHGNNIYTLFTSMFMHGGIMHIVGNMLFLWIFADNIEATIGSFPFLIFYLMGGLVASALHIFLSDGTGMDLSSCCNICGNPPCMEGGSPCPGSIPTVGASGAIAAVLGAYLVMFPKSRVRLFVIYFFRSIYISAMWFLGFWIAQQLYSGFSSLGPEAAASGGTAWWAHIGGFIFGVIAGFFAKQGMKKDSGSMRPPENEPDYSTKEFV